MREELLSLILETSLRDYPTICQTTDLKIIFLLLIFFYLLGHHLSKGPIPCDHYKFLGNSVTTNL